MQNDEPTLQDELIAKIVIFYERFHPLHTDYKFSRIHFERIFRKLARFDNRHLEKIYHFCQDLELVYNKIDAIYNNPLMKHNPEFWDNYKLMFPGRRDDRENIVELDLLKGYKEQFRKLIKSFLSTHKEIYVRTKPKRDFS